MDLNQYILALKARRKAFLMVLAATDLHRDRRRAARAEALRRHRDAHDRRARRADDGARAHVAARARRLHLQTQIDLIAERQGRRQGRRATSSSRSSPACARTGRSDTGGVGIIDDWIARQLLEKLKVDSAASNVLIVTTRRATPKYAADVANGFTKAYLDASLALRTEPSREAAEWFDEQLKDAAHPGDAGADQARRVPEGRRASPRRRAHRRRVHAPGGAVDPADRGGKATYDDAQTRYKQAQEPDRGRAPLEALPEVLANGYISTAQGRRCGRAEARDLQEKREVLGAEPSAVPAHARPKCRPARAS